MVIHIPFLIQSFTIPLMNMQFLRMKSITTRSGNGRLQKKTVGWKFIVQWEDGTEQWSPLKPIK